MSPAVLAAIVVLVTLAPIARAESDARVATGATVYDN
jgi:hypothetical protein